MLSNIENSAEHNMDNNTGNSMENNTENNTGNSMHNNTENSMEPLYAGFFVRLAAYLLDWIIVTVGLLIVKIPFGISALINPENFMVRDFIFQYSVADIISYVLGVTYFILLTYKTGSTLGKKALHLKVISTDEDRKPTFFEILYRETVGRFLSGLILQGGYLMIFVHKENRGLHDWMADTKVIYYHEKIVHVKTPITKREVPVYVPAPKVPQAMPKEIVNEMPKETAEEIITNDTALSFEASCEVSSDAPCEASSEGLSDASCEDPFDAGSEAQ